MYIYIYIYIFTISVKQYKLLTTHIYMYLTSLVLLIKTHHLTSLLENVFIQSVSGFILCDIFYLCGNAKSYLSVTSDNISSSVIKSSAAATQHWRSVRVWMEPDGTCSLNEVLQFVGGIIYNTYTLPPYTFLMPPTM